MARFRTDVDIQKAGDPGTMKLVGVSIEIDGRFGRIYSHMSGKPREVCYFTWAADGSSSITLQDGHLRMVVEIMSSGWAGLDAGDVCDITTDLWKGCVHESGRSATSDPRTSSSPSADPLHALIPHL